MEQEKLTPKQVLSDYAMLTVATVIMSVGIYFFKFPNHFSTGGVSGISGSSQLSEGEVELQNYLIFTLPFAVDLKVFPHGEIEGFSVEFH